MRRTNRYRRSRIGMRQWLIVLLAMLALFPVAALCAQRNQVATDRDGRPLRIAGSVVVMQPDIELFEMLTGGAAEPRREWTLAAGRLYTAALRTRLLAAGTTLVPDYHIPEDLPADSRLGQVIRLNEAVSRSVVAYTAPGSVLATKRGRGLDWTLGPGVAELHRSTGADYALFATIRDTYASGGRAALRVASLLLLGGDIGGGRQLGVSTLVDLRTGQVVWFNTLARQSGDLRDAEGAAATVQHLLAGLPL